jgi:DNA-binding SARP family transcriptional activator
VEASVEEGVELPVESARPSSAAAIELRLLGPLALYRRDEPVALPPSRKLRALLAYLALAPHPPSRSQLCELLWDVPNDPRGELRWCLSKLRRLLDEAGRPRVKTPGDRVHLEFGDCFVDAAAVAAAIDAGVATLSLARLRDLAALFAGAFLAGLEVARSPGFAAWLAAQRRRFRAAETALLERLAAETPEGERRAHLERLLQLSPFEMRFHARLLEGLAAEGRLAEGDAHIAAGRPRAGGHVGEWYHRDRGAPGRQLRPRRLAGAR